MLAGWTGLVYQDMCDPKLPVSNEGKLNAHLDALVVVAFEDFKPVCD